MSEFERWHHHHEPDCDDFGPPMMGYGNMWQEAYMMPPQPILIPPTIAFTGGYEGCWPQQYGYGGAWPGSFYGGNSVYGGPGGFYANQQQYWGGGYNGGYNYLWNAYPQYPVYTQPYSYYNGWNAYPQTTYQGNSVYGGPGGFYANQQGYYNGAGYGGDAIAQPFNMLLQGFNAWAGYDIARRYAR